MADKNFVVKNSLTVNTAFFANGSLVSLGTINNSSNGVLVTVNSITIGNAGTSSVVNATTFTGTSYNSGNLNSQPASYYTNASNITTGTLPYTQLGAAVVNTSGNFIFSGINTYTNNLEIRSSKLVINTSSSIWVNGSIGLAGQVIASNSTGLYWLTPPSGTVTSVATSNGITGGTITTSGTLYAVGNNGITVTTSGIGAKAANGISVDASGINVVGTYGVASNTSATYAVGANGISVDASGINVKAANGIVANTTGTFAKQYNGITVDSNGIGAKAANGISVTVDGINVVGTYGVASNTSATYAVGANGITITSSGINVLANNGIVANTSGTFAKAANGISVTADGINVTAGSSGGLVSNTSGVFVDTGTIATRSYVTGLGYLTGISSSGNVAYDSSRLNGQGASYYAANNQTMYLGTTAIAINRASATGLSLAGVSIDGTSYNITQYTINQSVGSGNSPTFAGLTLTGDIATYRSNATQTGVIFLGTGNGGRYLYYDGSNYTMPGAQLYVNGSLALHSANYNDYAPSKTGTGASGTWGINITGNAGTAYGKAEGSLSVSYAATAGSATTAGSTTFLSSGSEALIGNNNAQNGGMDIIGNQINAAIGYNGENAEIAINYSGYQGGTTRYRNFTVFNGKNVGIGYFTGSSGDFTAAGNVTAYSDIRLKTDIETISGALEKVLNMRGVMFTRKDTGVRSTGVIAQEIQEILPEVVIEGKDNLSVAYGNIVGVLIEAIKELKAEIEELKGK
jgi:hypothetical protein